MPTQPGMGAILFDLYGTLIYEEPGLDDAEGPTIFGALAAEAGVPEAEYRAARNASSHFAMTCQLEDAARAADTLQRLGLYTAPDQAAARMAKAEALHQLELKLRAEASRTYPTTLDTLAEVRRRGYKTALVSNCTTYAEVSLDELGLMPLFDHLSLSHRVGTVKPDPRIFRDATEALGVAPGACYFVGDGGGSEMSASAALGMTAVLIVQPHAMSLTRSYSGQRYTIRALAELLEIV